ncbi:hypothetical protein JY651_45095 [Pyxidicoccus parkwayensis]|jgi:hypothetical protein|uniref:Uncharacterized protein n=1 Tax=Pyxidicoccus parkwayensis TaxID=2813578 RepID=A0ABX7NXY4_9BACT|nr:hypothetical protein [Pyxidicoccus parkwaysis]QSQ22231.1 hypothetical protein JY651_45095 [Pyxidicoccus parkwaysis]
MRFKKLGSEDVGEQSSRRHMNPDTGEEEINISDQDLAATPPLEDEPDFRDILPDQIHEFRRGDEEEEGAEVTAQPDEPIRPIRRDQLPEG